MAYTIFGPFVNGSSPGISSSFLNPLETFVASINSAATDANITADGTGMETLKWLKVNPTAVVQNGSTSGSMTRDGAQWEEPGRNLERMGHDDCAHRRHGRHRRRDRRSGHVKGVRL